MVVRYVPDVIAGQVTLDSIPFRVFTQQDEQGNMVMAYQETQVSRLGSMTDRQEAELNLPVAQQVIKPLVWRSWHRGMGVAAREQQGTDYRYFYSYGFDARQPRLLSRGPARTDLTSVANSSTVVKFFEIGSKLYSLNGRVVQEINTSTDAVSLSKDFGVGNAGTDAAEFNGKIWVAMGNGTELWSFDGTTWVQNAATGIYADYLTVGRNRLWRALGSQVSATAADPSVGANWTSLVDIDSTGNSITGLTLYLSHIIAAKTDGLWELDEGFNPRNLMRWVESFPESDNGKQVGEWNGFIFYPNVTGIAAFRAAGQGDGTSMPIGPESLPTNNSPARGKCTAWTTWGFWLFAAFLNDDGDTYIFAGRPATQQEQAEEGRLMVWHTLDRLVGAECRAMHVTMLSSNPRLYVGRGANVSYYILPKYGGFLIDEDGNPVDSAVRFATGGYIYFEAHDGGSPATQKTFHDVWIESKGLDSSENFKAQYRIDGGSWGDLGAVRTSPRTMLRFPTGMKGYRLELRFVDQGSDSTTSYIITNVVVRATERPTQTQMINMRLVLESDQLTRVGTREVYSAEQKITKLQTLSEQAEPVEFMSPYGTKYRVLVVPPVNITMGKYIGEATFQAVADVTLAIYGAPGNTGVYGTAKYGSGVIYG